jgi:hypothetical protein
MAVVRNRISSGPSAIEFTESATRERVARYREHVKQLTGMMRSEPDPKLRGKLRELVGCYRELADSISNDTD